jgi:molybdopterin molybdotransferase
VRLRGFADLATVARAHAWIDGRAASLPAEEVELDAALGRVAAAPIVAATDHPPVPRAGIDGYAVRSGDLVGATSYDPVSLTVQPPALAIGGGAAALVAAGAPLPPGADAVLGFDAAQPAGAAVEAVAAVAPFAGVDRPGQQLRAGSVVAPAGRALGVRELALLAALGVRRVSVVRRPRVRIVIAGPKEAGAPDAHGAALGALVARDGGDPSVERAALRGALGAPPAGSTPDLVLATGRTGTGSDDDAAPALAAAGELALHGVALRPGASAGLGVAGGSPVVLLPGDPLACLVAYELLGGRLVRRLAGRPPELPHRACDAEVRRKIVSAVGFVEVCQVRLVDGRIEPLGVFDFGGLAAASRADGFVVVPAALEGYAPGARVTVHLHG